MVWVNISHNGYLGPFGEGQKVGMTETVGTGRGSNLGCGVLSLFSLSRRQESTTETCTHSQVAHAVSSCGYAHRSPCSASSV